MKAHAALNQDIKRYEQQIRQSEAELRATAEGKSTGALNFLRPLTMLLTRMVQLHQQSSTCPPLRG